MMRNKYRYWQSRASQLRSVWEEATSDRKPEKEKTLEDMTKEELIAEIKRLHAIIKSLNIQNAELQGMYVTAQGSKGKGEMKSAKPRLPIH